MTILKGLPLSGSGSDQDYRRHMSPRVLMSYMTNRIVKKLTILSSPDIPLARGSLKASPKSKVVNCHVSARSLRSRRTGSLYIVLTPWIKRKLSMRG